jgi:hypothetical protein
MKHVLNNYLLKKYIHTRFAVVCMTYGTPLSAWFTLDMRKLRALRREKRGRQKESLTSGFEIYGKENMWKKI